ncbi:DUF1572 family protein [Bacillus sp. FJAT-49705]|uniref:DUF1572 family protein n=1 Tax=Cytobacillus citreus TaxID=2833586 RepID=A0ABS5NZQ6_9BACI|nr:DUF1572 family protein [Cytobacillus citreus]MBS4193071.1 DUF1572 family protein [Cytobacillus citreus]
MTNTHNEISSEYLRVIKLRFREMKNTAEKTFEQLDEEMLFWFPNDNSNSISIIVKHMSGNMVSRWTDFLNSDGEKPDRDRDGEFEHTISNRNELYEVWEKGWNVFLNALESIEEEQLLRKIFIRNEPHTLIEAIERQMYHYSYHVGQIIYIAKQLKSEGWTSLTIPHKK